VEECHVTTGTKNGMGSVSAAAMSRYGTVGKYCITPHTTTKSEQRDVENEIAKATEQQPDQARVCATLGSGSWINYGEGKSGRRANPCWPCAPGVGRGPGLVQANRHGGDERTVGCLSIVPIVVGQGPVPLF
jgi:hypothetical protein